MRDGCLGGGRNTAYYQKIANGNKRKNTIHSLNVGDNVIEGTEKLLEHATDFYKTLLGEPEVPEIRLGDMQCSQLIENDRKFLTKEFDMEEIKEVFLGLSITR